MGFMDIITKLIPVIVIILILLILASNIRVVQQSRAYVIERLAPSRPCGVWACTSRSPLLSGWLKMCP